MATPPITTATMRSIDRRVIASTDHLRLGVFQGPSPVGWSIVPCIALSESLLDVFRYPGLRDLSWAAPVHRGLQCHRCAFTPDMRELRATPHTRIENAPGSWRATGFCRKVAFSSIWESVTH